MEIISHRGLWLDKCDKNSFASFERSFESGYGTETDIRDLDGTIVISHDMPTSSSMPMTLDSFLALYTMYAPKTLALNVKADGLQEPVTQLLNKHSIENYVLFDMSIPDLIQTSKAGLKFVTRLSEYELEMPFDSLSSGVWVDEFNESWVTSETIFKLSQTQSRVFIVSGELHGRDHMPQWLGMKKNSIHELNNIVLCTDFPRRAEEYFFG